MRWRSRSMSSTLTCTVSPMLRISLGWLTCDHESSEMWIRPSMPSRSTKAPNSTMFEIWPSMMRPGCSRSRIAWRCSLRSSSSTARRLRTTLLRGRLSSMTFDSIVWPRYSSRFGTRRMSTSEAGRKPRTPRSTIRPPLTTSMTEPWTGSPRLGRRLDAPPGALEAGTLLGEDQAAVLVLLGEDEGVDLLADLDLFVRVDRLADRELVGGDDPLALVTDVDEDLVLVDAHHCTGDDVALLEGDDRRVVVRERSCRRSRAASRRSPRRRGRRCSGGRGHSGFHRQRITLAARAQAAPWPRFL